MNKSALKIRHDFDAAAQHYDRFAAVQAEAAEQLVDWAGLRYVPQSILDIGSGTGFVAEAAARKWPRAAITALDHAPAMLAEARRKLPRLRTVIADAANANIPERFDAIFSSMMLHWLPEPQKILRRWQGWLKPDGHLCVALLTRGSFGEWESLCRDAGAQSGLWEMPDVPVADDLIARRELRNVCVTYDSAHDFLRRLKSIGAATPHKNHIPLPAATLRRILERAPRPFAATYNLLYLDLKA